VSGQHLFVTEREPLAHKGVLPPSELRRTRVTGSERHDARGANNHRGVWGQSSRATTQIEPRKIFENTVA
jgi:hypothetical protein